MDLHIQCLEESEIELFKETYFGALESDWETLEGSNNRMSWNRNLRDWLRGDFLIFVLKVNSNMKGYIVGDRTRILHLWISSDYRKSGLGSKLLDHFLEYQKMKRNYTFNLKVHNSNIDFFLNKYFTITCRGDNFSYLKYN